MKCIDQILSRRSIRKFKDEDVSEEVLNNILEAGRLAPSATNNQPWYFVVVRDEKGKDGCCLFFNHYYFCYWGILFY
ncbi:MAG: nitroreductase family protein [Candidatus Bathyarchaeota archaeon]